ncbi:MAG: hypothetical protein R3282_08860 [Rhodothermales bacterium]|nr:hypothetical protein [Rhodothermales bacterium]
MVLRRLVEAIRAQDWSTILMEVVIVVIGVFLGIEVSNWNEDRLARELESYYLDRIHADVMDAERRIESRRERRESALTNLESAYVKLFDPSVSVLEADECYALSTSWILSNATLSRLPTLEELKFGPGTEIVSDRELRTQIEIVLRGYDQSSEFIDRYGPFMVEPGQAFPDVLTLRNYTDETGELRVSSECDLSAMRNNAQFLNAIALNRDIKDALYRYAAPLLANFETFHRRLDRYLDVEHP